MFEEPLSSKSDVWSFGVLVWEIFSYGLLPYGNNTTNKSLLDLIIEGYRLKRPVDSNDDIYQRLMSNCWLENPNDRPNFTKIVDDIRQLDKQYCVL